MKYIHRVVNANTSEVIDNDYTKKELDEVKANKTRIDAEIAEAEAKATAKEALLNKLGITAEEAVLLLS